MTTINQIIEKELEKINNVQVLYSNILNSIDFNKHNITDHILNIRHYIELLEEKIDDLNNYAIIENTPVCSELIERNKLINDSNDLFKQFMIYSIINSK